MVSLHYFEQLQGLISTARSLSNYSMFCFAVVLIGFIGLLGLQ